MSWYFVLKKNHTKEVKRRNLASSSVLYSFRLQAIIAWLISTLINFFNVEAM